MKLQNIEKTAQHMQVQVDGRDLEFSCIYNYFLQLVFFSPAVSWHLSMRLLWRKLSWLLYFYRLNDSDGIIASSCPIPRAPGEV